MVDVSLTLTYRFGIVLGTLGLNTRGCASPACRGIEKRYRRHHRAICSAVSGLTCRAICHQIPVTINIFSFPLWRKPRDAISTHLALPPFAKSLEALKCFTLQNQCRPPSVWSPFLRRLFQQIAQLLKTHFDTSTAMSESEIQPNIFRALIARFLRAIFNFVLT